MATSSAFVMSVPENRNNSISKKRKERMHGTFKKFVTSMCYKCFSSWPFCKTHFQQPIHISDTLFRHCQAYQDPFNDLNSTSSQTFNSLLLHLWGQIEVKVLSASQQCLNSRVGSPCWARHHLLLLLLLVPLARWKKMLASAYYSLIRLLQLTSHISHPPFNIVHLQFTHPTTPRTVIEPVILAGTLKLPSGIFKLSRRSNQSHWL